MKFGFNPRQEAGRSGDRPEDERINLHRRTFLGGAVAATALLSADVRNETKVESATGTFSERFEAAQQLAKNGITDYQRQAYKPGVSEALANGLTPFNYNEGTGAYYDAKTKQWVLGNKEKPVEEVERVVSAVAEGVTEDEKQQQNRIAQELKTLHPHFPEAYIHRVVRNRTDAWRMYLGLSQRFKTFGISHYKPNQSKEDRYYYSLNDFLKNQAEFLKMTQSEVLQLFTEKLKDPSVKNALHLEDKASGVMGHYTVSRGEDARGIYISYYDRWDLKGSLEGKKGVVGRPFEVYDRIYYDPKTFEVIVPEQPKVAS